MLALVVRVTRVKQMSCSYRWNPPISLTNATSSSSLLSPVQKRQNTMSNAADATRTFSWRSGAKESMKSIVVDSDSSDSSGSCYALSFAIHIVGVTAWP